MNNFASRAVDRSAYHPRLHRSRSYAAFSTTPRDSLQFNCNGKSCVLFGGYPARLLAPTGSCNRQRVIPLVDPALWTGILADAITPDILRLHLERSIGLHSDMVITRLLSHLSA